MGPPAVDDPRPVLLRKGDLVPSESGCALVLTDDWAVYRLPDEFREHCWAAYRAGWILGADECCSGTGNECRLLPFDVLLQAYTRGMPAQGWRARVVRGALEEGFEAGWWLAMAAEVEAGDWEAYRRERDERRMAAAREGASPQGETKP